MARRLVAILAADVVGYSAMMERDEQGTLAQLIAFRKSVFDPRIRDHNGRIVKLMGDGALVEFSSVVDAVNCAVAIQSEVMQSPQTELRLRIGINLGDVITQAGDIYGEGVNIAARLEALAETGGICISALVHQSISNRVDARFADTGEHTLKNMTKPVQIFRWVPDGGVETVLAPAKANSTGRPAIAVLAFDNMSADPEQEYFSDGIAEDLITALSHFRDFAVIARNTSFTYKGQPIRVDEVCRDLGVRYLLEGSVRKAGGRVRVTAQLIDGESGAHLWAAQFDRDLDDIFAVQDAITAAIVRSVAPQTIQAEMKRSRVKPTGNLTAWDKVLQARWHLGKFSREDNATARLLLDEACNTDSDLSDAHAALAQCDLMSALHVWCNDILSSFSSARTSALIATRLDDHNANAHGMLGMAELFLRNYDNALRHLSRAIDLNPNLAIGHGNFAAYHGISGDYEQARNSARRAVELSPRDPLKAFWMGGMGIGAYIAGAYEDSVSIARDTLREHPGFASLMRQETAALAMLGRQDEATASITRLIQYMPGLTISQVRQIVPVRYPDDHERWLEGLRRAGLPE